jgi:hypothetical protein
MVVSARQGAWTTGGNFKFFRWFMSLLCHHVDIQSACYELKIWTGLDF